MKVEEEKKRARRNIEKQLHQSKIDEIWPGGKDKGGKTIQKSANFDILDPPELGGSAGVKNGDEFDRRKCLATTPKRKREIGDLGERGERKNSEVKFFSNAVFEVGFGQKHTPSILTKMMMSSKDMSRRPVYPMEGSRRMIEISERKSKKEVKEPE